MGPSSIWGKEVYTAIADHLTGFMDVDEEKPFAVSLGNDFGLAKERYLNQVRNDNNGSIWLKPPYDQSQSSITTSYSEEPDLHLRMQWMGVRHLRKE